MDNITRALALLTPDDLFPVWRFVDLMERRGEMSPDEAVQWKDGVFVLMLMWGLEPDDLVRSSTSR